MVVIFIASMMILSIMIYYFSKYSNIRYPSITYSQDPDNNFKGILLRNYFKKSEMVKYYNYASRGVTLPWNDFAMELCAGLFDKEFRGSRLYKYFGNELKTIELNDTKMSHTGKENNTSIIISFGSSSVFSFDERLITLHSGDIYVTNLNKENILVDRVCEHSVPRILDDILQNNEHHYILIEGYCESIELKKNN